MTKQTPHSTRTSRTSTSTSMPVTPSWVTYISFHLAQLLVMDEILCHTAFPRSFSVLHEWQFSRWRLLLSNWLSAIDCCIYCLLHCVISTIGACILINILSHLYDIEKLPLLVQEAVNVPFWLLLSTKFDANLVMGSNTASINKNNNNNNNNNNK